MRHQNTYVSSHDTVCMIDMELHASPVNVPSSCRRLVTVIRSAITLCRLSKDIKQQKYVKKWHDKKHDTHIEWHKFDPCKL